MSAGLNRVMLIGNIGADPDLKTTQGGQAVLNLRLATNETYIDKSNTKKERTEWHQIVIWGRRAEALGKLLVKGERLYVEGRIETQQYEKNGERRYITKIVANDVILLGGRGEGQSSGRGSSRPAREEEHEEQTSGGSAKADPFDDIPFIRNAADLDWAGAFGWPPRWLRW